MLKLTEQEQTLLRFAAKAAGREPDDIDDQGAWFKVPCDFARDGLAWRGWNPLRDDGDAFRLMVQLRLFTEISEDAMEARVDARGGHHWTVVLDEQNSAHAAMREAITRCAALLGGWTP